MNICLLQSTLTVLDHCPKAFQRTVNNKLTRLATLKIRDVFETTSINSAHNTNVIDRHDFSQYKIQLFLRKIELYVTHNTRIYIKYHLSFFYKAIKPNKKCYQTVFKSCIEMVRIYPPFILAIIISIKPITVKFQKDKN